jgi:hypothetical protein
MLTSVTEIQIAAMMISRHCILRLRGGAGGGDNDSDSSTQTQAEQPESEVNDISAIHHKSPAVSVIT